MAARRYEISLRMLKNMNFFFQLDFQFFFYICVKLTSKRASEEEKNNENRFSIRHASYGASKIF